MSATLTLPVGASFTIVPHARNHSGADVALAELPVVHTSSDESIAAVTASGIGFVRAVGTAVITTRVGFRSDTTTITGVPAEMASFNERLMREGRYFDNNTDQTLHFSLGQDGNALTNTRGTPLTAGVGQFVIQYQVPVGWCLFPRRIYCSMDQPGGLKLQMSQMGWNFTRGSNYQWFGAASGGAMDFAFPQQSEPIYENDHIDLIWYPQGTVRPFGTVMIDGTLLTADFDFNAKYTLAFLGDSMMGFSQYINGDATTEVTNRHHVGAFQVKQQIIDNKKVSVRLVNKSFGGATSQTAQIALSGYIDFDFNALVIGLGHNDVSLATGQAQYQGAIRNIITTARRKNPKCDILLCTPPGTNVAGMGTYRTYLAQLAAEYTSDPGVKLLDLSDPAIGWDDTNYAPYTIDGTHFNRAGHDRFATAVYNALLPMPWLSTAT